MSKFVAVLETRNHSFFASGETAAHAVAALRAGWLRHVKEVFSTLEKYGPPAYRVSALYDEWTGREQDSSFQKNVAERVGSYRWADLVRQVSTFEIYPGDCFRDGETIHSISRKMPAGGWSRLGGSVEALDEWIDELDPRGHNPSSCEACGVRVQEKEFAMDGDRFLCMNCFDRSDP